MKEEGKFTAADSGAPAATPKEQEKRNQEVIRALHDISQSEFMTPSFGEAYPVSRDPHLRLRRTLTPSLNMGLPGPKYIEAQFMLSKEDTSGKRMSLEFGVPFGGTTRYFAMDAFAFGASEAEANVRVVTLHGMSPGASRTRWHSLGERYNVIAKMASASSTKRVRFVALDWHSIDRSVDDGANTEFLTCLPKHMMEMSSDDENLEFAIQLFSEDRQEWAREFAKCTRDGTCPRTFDDGGRILRAVIEEGLGWGGRDKPLVLGIKSWSGGLGMRMLAQCHRDRCTIKGDGITPSTFADNIMGVILMHPACYDISDIEDAMSSGMIPAALICWAKDDPMVPCKFSRFYLDAAGNTEAKLVTYEKGGHHNFDGSEGLPNFDDDVIDWIENLPL